MAKQIVRATQRKPTPSQVKKAQEFLAGPRGPGATVRSLKDIENELAELHPKARQAQAPFLELAHRINELAKERDAHPDTLVANLANLRLGTEGNGYRPPGEPPELGAVLQDIAGELDDVEACIHVVYYAMETQADVKTTAAALYAGAVNNITTQIDRLRDAIEGARLRGSRMVVVKPSQDAEAQS